MDIYRFFRRMCDPVWHIEVVFPVRRVHRREDYDVQMHVQFSVARLVQVVIFPNYVYILHKETHKEMSTLQYLYDTLTPSK